LLGHEPVDEIRLMRIQHLEICLGELLSECVHDVLR